MSLDEIREYSIADEIWLWIDLIEWNIQQLTDQHFQQLKFLLWIIEQFIKDTQAVIDDSVFTMLNININDDDTNNNIYWLINAIKWLFVDREKRKHLQDTTSPQRIDWCIIFERREELKRKEDALVDKLNSVNIIERLKSIIKSNKDTGDRVNEIVSG